MSSRQKNKAKRMAKLVAKQRSRDVDTSEKRWVRAYGCAFVAKHRVISTRLILVRKV